MTVVEEPEWLAAARVDELEHSASNGVPYTSQTAAERAQPGSAAPDDLFRRYTMTELRKVVSTEMDWLVRGFLVQPTYGQVAGELKTLKSYLATFLGVAVASGQPFLGRWQVETPGPVLLYVGEGGRDPWFRRADRIAQAMGVNLDDLPIEPTFDVGPIGSTRFQESLARDLDQLNPALFLLDPLYAYHGTKADASNLHQEGALLSSLSAPCMEAGTSLLIVNHFNQTGSGDNLKRITQAGSGEWVDTWLLTSHRDEPDVDRGDFHLRLDIGSRQWGGTRWDLDLHIGRFDDTTGTHDGAITWNLGTAGSGGRNEREAAALAVVNEHPYELIREDIALAIGGNLRKAREVVDMLEHQGEIHTVLVKKADARGRARSAWRYVPGPKPADPLDVSRDPSSDPGRQQTLIEEQ